jgi:hypothetical protein
MDNSKLHISAEGGTVSLGNQIINLQDTSSYGFKAQSLKAFCEYLAAHPGGWKIFVGKGVIEGYKDKIEGAGLYQRKPDAQCPISFHPALNKLFWINNRPMGLANINLFLDGFKKYFLPEAKQLAVNLRTFKGKKIISVERSKELNGNFSNSIKMEGDKATDFTAPEFLAFKVPIYEGYDSSDKSNMIELVFNISNEFVQEDEKWDSVFTFTNYELDETVELFSTELLRAKLGATSEGNEVYFGALEIKRETDAWMYKENAVRI